MKLDEFLSKYPGCAVSIRFEQLSLRYGVQVRFADGWSIHHLVPLKKANSLVGNWLEKELGRIDRHLSHLNPFLESCHLVPKVDKASGESYSKWFMVQTKPTPEQRERERAELEYRGLDHVLKFDPPEGEEEPEGCTCDLQVLMMSGCQCGSKE